MLPRLRLRPPPGTRSDSLLPQNRAREALRAYKEQRAVEEEAAASEARAAAARAAVEEQQAQEARRAAAEKRNAELATRTQTLRQQAEARRRRSKDAMAREAWAAAGGPLAEVERDEGRLLRETEAMLRRRHEREEARNDPAAAAAAADASARPLSSLSRVRAVPAWRRGL